MNIGKVLVFGGILLQEHHNAGDNYADYGQRMETGVCKAIAIARERKHAMCIHRAMPQVG